jgi:hypothetical protein
MILHWDLTFIPDLTFSTHRSNPSYRWKDFRRARIRKAWKLERRLILNRLRQREPYCVEADFDTGILHSSCCFWTFEYVQLEIWPAENGWNILMVKKFVSSWFFRSTDHTTSQMDSVIICNLSYQLLDSCVAYWPDFDFARRCFIWRDGSNAALASVH